MILRWWIWLFLPAMAFGTTCEELNSRWLKYHRDFAVKLERKHFACEEGKDFLTAQSINDLYEADPTHSFYEVARRLIHQVTVGECEDGVAAQMGNGNVVTLCAPFFKLRRLRRAAVFFHEASHGREKDPGHVVCENGNAKGKSTCDESLKDGYDGSGNNWEAHYVRFLFQSSSDTALVEEAKGHMKYLLNHRINALNDVQKTTWLN